jgi:hypothetical protein
MFEQHEHCQPKIVTWTFILPYVIAAENKKESVLLVTIIGMIIILFAIQPCWLTSLSRPYCHGRVERGALAAKLWYVGGRSS